MATNTISTAETMNSTKEWPTGLDTGGHTPTPQHCSRQRDWTWGVQDEQESDYKNPKGCHDGYLPWMTVVLRGGWSILWVSHPYSLALLLQALLFAYGFSLAPTASSLDTHMAGQSRGNSCFLGAALSEWQTGLGASIPLLLWRHSDGINHTIAQWSPTWLSCNCSQQ